MQCIYLKNTVFKINTAVARAERVRMRGPDTTRDSPRHGRALDTGLSQRGKFVQIKCFCFSVL